jgi:hypothetical protein
VCKPSAFLHCRCSVLGKGRAAQTEHRNGCKHQHRFTHHVFFWGLLTRANNNYLLGGYADRRSRSRQLQIFHADEPTFIEATNSSVDEIFDAICEGPASACWEPIYSSKFPTICEAPMRRSRRAIFAPSPVAPSFRNAPRWGCDLTNDDKNK